MFIPYSAKLSTNPFATITPKTIDKERTYGPIKVNPTELLEAVQTLVEDLPYEG